MTKKYQIFISSTYEDLKKERDQVVKAALEMGHIPVGMEMFSAADEEQWRIITRHIDQSDYYALIIAHRYGSVNDGISYTEKEYDYAVSQGVPVIGFIIEDDVNWPPAMIDQEENAIRSLEGFKNKVKSKPVGFWNGAEDLHGKFSIAFMKLIANNPRPGWARADEVAGPELTKELTRLSSENAQLRKKVGEISAIEANKEHDKDQNMTRLLKSNKTTACYRTDARGTEWQSHTEKTLLDVFSSLAPKLLYEASTVTMRQEVVFKFFGYEANDAYPMPKNYMDNWINDFSCLGLITPSIKKHSVNDKKEYWMLTDDGFRVHSSLRRLQLEIGDETDLNLAPEDDAEYEES